MATPNQFKKKWNDPCMNQEFLVKHLLTNCALLKRFFHESHQKNARQPTLEDIERCHGEDEPEGAFPNQ